MTAQESTPETGQESTGVDWNNRHLSRDLEQIEAEELAHVVEEKKQELRASSDTVTRALLNDDVPLTDEKVAALWDTASHLEAIARSLTSRVAEEHRFRSE
jgi:hypothetical protein